MWCICGRNDQIAKAQRLALLTPDEYPEQIALSAMAQDTPGWSEKGNRKGADGEPSAKKTPQRPSKRKDSASGDAESSVVRTPSSTGSKKVAKAAATAGQRDVSFASRLGFPFAVFMICLLGIVLVGYARSTRGELVKPVQNLDHWHAVYGVYSCNAGGEIQPTDGAARDAKYLPPFLSNQDDTGIHSHGDGIMHVHPFFELSSGRNAQIRHFLSEMNVEVTPEAITVNNAFDPAQNLVAGEQCADNTGTAEIKLLHWDFDFEALNENRPDPEVFTADEIPNVKYEHDREVYVIAYVSEDTPIEDIPIPPQVRFETLSNVSSAIEYEPAGLAPVDTGTEVDGDDSEEDGE